MNIKLDLPAAHLAEIRGMARDTESTHAEVVTGIVKMYLDKVFSCRAGSCKTGHAPSGPARITGMIIAETLDGSVGNMYADVKSACVDLNLHPSLVYCVLRGARSSTGGYSFRRL